MSKSGVSARLYSPERPYVCQSCVKCKSCGSEGVNVHVGNLPLCSMCFKLRQQGNYCPLCQRCYNENDFDTKVSIYFILQINKYIFTCVIVKIDI